MGGERGGPSAKDLGLKPKEARASGSEDKSRPSGGWDTIGLSDEERAAYYEEKKAKERAGSGLKIRGRDSGTASREKTDYFREQLDGPTLDKLFNLDLANNPKAELSLLVFLKNMGVRDAELKGSKVVKVMRQKHETHEALAQAFKPGEIADSIVGWL